MKNFTKPHPLQDAAFLTEVHHINEKGEDAGVVYCEMQARENTSEDRTHFQMVQHMYPGHCGYKVGRRGGGGGVKAGLTSRWSSTCIQVTVGTR